jgi:hypothetical protein
MQPQPDMTNNQVDKAFLRNQLIHVHCNQSLVLNYIKDCQSILEEIVSADRTKNNNKMAKLSN